MTWSYPLKENLRVPYFESSIQSDLAARSKSPIAIGGGVTFKLFNNCSHVLAAITPAYEQCV